MKITKSGVTSTGVHQKRDKRLMVQYRFNLNVQDDLEGRLADDCAKLQSGRLFRPSMVKALRLFFDLTFGYTEVLRELFPAVVREIETSFQSAEIEALRREIEDLKGRGYMPAATPEKAANSVTGHDFGMKITSGNSGKAVANFGASLGGFFGD